MSLHASPEWSRALIFMGLHASPEWSRALIFMGLHVCREWSRTLIFTDLHAQQKKFWVLTSMGLLFRNIKEGQTDKSVRSKLKDEKIINLIHCLYAALFSLFLRFSKTVPAPPARASKIHIVMPLSSPVLDAP